MKKDKKIVIVTLSIIVVTILSIVTYNLSFNKEIIASAKTEKRENNKILSVMLETSAHSGKYQESTSADWPDDGYVFNEKLSKCENGSKLSYDAGNNKVTVHTKLTDRCYVYFDATPDVYVAVNNKQPTYGAVGSVTCSNASASFNDKYQRLEITSINDYKINCNLNYTERTDKTKLNAYISNLAGTNQGSGQVVNEKLEVPLFGEATTLSQSEYGSTSQYSATSGNATSGTAVSNIFTYSGNEWQVNASNLTADTYYHLNITIPTTGYYQICYYAKSGTSGSISLQTYNGTTSKEYNSISYSKTEKVCSNFAGTEKLTAGTTYHIVASVSSYSTGDVVGAFSLKKTTSITNVSDYRYEGSNPNNYVWFNNELWRIVGVFDESTHGVSGTNLVKIIRNESIGELMMVDRASNKDWPSSYINNILNSYYFYKDNGSESDFCLIYGKMKGNCDYRRIGLSTEARNMLRKVNWNFTSEDAYDRSVYYYASERNISHYNDASYCSSSNEYVGLLYPSDLYFGILMSACPDPDGYEKDVYDCMGYTWLTNYGEAWYLTRNTYWRSLTGEFFKSSSAHHPVFPSVYLNEFVYVISGSGTSTDPYIIGM